MTDPATGASDTGASSPAAPQDGAQAGHDTAAASVAPGAFGATRGSGLARGKRTGTPAAKAASASQSEYQPTTIAVIVPKLEYKNPFAAATESVAASAEVPQSGTKEDAKPAFVPAPAPVFREPTPVYSAPARVTPTPAPEPAFIPPAPAPIADAPAPLAEPAAKPELKILPPAETRRTQVQWDNSPPAPKPASSNYPDRAPRADRRQDRREDPYAGQPRDPRDEPAYSPRQPRDPRDEPRRDDRPTFRTDAQRAREGQRSAPVASTPAKSGGFFAWLKGLFGGAKAPTPEAPSRSHDRPEGEFARDGEHGHRRRRRGGRGRHHGGERGGQGGYSGGGHAPSGEGDSSGGGRERSGEHSGDHQGGGQRRPRHRGGRGRGRGHDDRGGPRPEGQQGGGFI